MAYASTTAHPAAGLSAKGLIAAFRESLARHRIYRQTKAELNGLSDRELADLGISRSGITRLALDAAYGRTK